MGRISRLMDRNGNVAGLVNAATGERSATYEYDPYGQILRKTGGAIAEVNPFRYSTHYTDSETDLVYYGLRYYNPNTGRWLNRDPIGEMGGLNLYGFSYNNPIGNVDTDGRFVLSLTMLVMDAGSAIKNGWQRDYEGMARDMALMALDAISLAADLGSGGFGGTALQGGRLALQGATFKNKAGLFAAAAHFFPDIVNSTGCPNPYGKLGGPDHHQEIADVAADIRSRGLQPEFEHMVPTPKGSKRKRFIDVIAL